MCGRNHLEGITQSLWASSSPSASSELRVLKGWLGPWDWLTLWAGSTECWGSALMVGVYKAIPGSVKWNGMGGWWACQGQEAFDLSCDYFEAVTNGDAAIGVSQGMKDGFLMQSLQWEVWCMPSPGLIHCGNVDALSSPQVSREMYKCGP